MLAAAGGRHAASMAVASVYDGCICLTAALIKGCFIVL
jgi:hypothetical protein